jgi:NAD(P)-dependent dehydrogenase (short-subunit alcohol dehydrogenase family)
MPKEKKLQPPQHQQRRPGREHKMKPRPEAEDERQRGTGKLQGKVAIITCGDSGIERANEFGKIDGAITAFTRSLSQALAEKCVRVNGVAPGPTWTPLIPSTYPAKEVATFGSDVPLGGPGQPEEIAPSYVFLGSDDSSYMTGQVLHPNGGTVVNG